MSQQAYEAFRSAGEYYAAELVVHTDRSPLYRYSRAIAEYFAHVPLTPYDGGKLFPCGRSTYSSGAAAGMALTPSFSYTYQLNNGGKLQEISPEGAEMIFAEFSRIAPLSGPHLVGGAGYTHSFINFRRILAEGLNGYRARVEALPEGDFRDAMLIVLEGIEVYRQRCLAHLRESNADEALIAALEKVPNSSPENIYEALVAWNFVYYVDGCDDIGGLDRALYPYWKGEDIRPLLTEVYRHVDVNDGWSMPLGPHYNELTIQCMDASHGTRRPSIQLLVTEDMPAEVWAAAERCIAAGGGQPALYNWNGFSEEMKNRLSQVTDEDREYMAFGGCTETMIEGLSNVGSDDAGINTALIFDGYMRQNLAEAQSFEQFMEGYAQLAEQTVADVCAMLEAHRKTRALHRPHPIRTLLVDDCIARMEDFNAGGARYYWSVINVAGLINVIDSMAVIKTLIFEEKRYSSAEFLEKLEARDPEFLARCRQVPKHGNDDDAVSAIANFLSARIYGEFEKHPCTPGGRYFPVSNQFATYDSAGWGVRSTPDGREDRSPLCDSCGAVHGRDMHGPTAMLKSVSALRLDLVLGTPVTNIRISKKTLPAVLRPLVEGFFALGGMQLQVTCASREDMLDALEHPEKHENLIVRIGGYSEYFNRLSPALKQTVIDRVEY